MSTSYDTDVVAWANEQAALLRAGKFSELDIEHIADEVEDVGKSELRELETRMAVLLAHLAKWAFQPARRGASWQITIRSQRKAIDRRLINTPSLKPELNDPEFWLVVWGDATRIATNETGLQDFPETCPWSVDQILDPDFLPE
jgi:hypothetical protein